MKYNYIQIFLNISNNNKTHLIVGENELKICQTLFDSYIDTCVLHFRNIYDG